jgi:hypothetical protein
MSQAEFGAQRRENLLDVVLERLQRGGKDRIYSRVVYVARFSKREQNVDAVKGMH